MKMYRHLQTDIAGLLRQARGLAVRSVNAVMTASYWEVGRRIVEAEQKGKRRAAYGEQLIEQLAVDLTVEFGRGFSKQNLHQMCAFYLSRHCLDNLVLRELPRCTQPSQREPKLSHPFGRHRLPNSI